MNYHFLVDNKFTDDYIKNVLEISDQNIFYFITNKPITQIKYSGGKQAQYSSKLYDEVVKSLKPGDSCIFHWLSPDAGTFVSKLPKNVKKVLLLMGGDVFEYPSSIHKYYAYDPISLAYFDKKVPHFAYNNWLSIPFQYAKLLFSKTIKPLYDRARYRKKLMGIRAYDYIGHWNRYDLELLRKRDGMTAVHLPYYYDVGLHDDLPDEDQSDKSLNIWIGNSATISNNHLDLFEKIRQKSFPDGYKLFLPLSYGDQEYAEYIEKKGKDYFGDHFNAIRGYLPRDEYYNLLNSCYYFIMHHNRMQAAGNIFALMKMGKKLFLKADSTTYKEYKTMGAHIFSTEELLENPTAHLRPLSEEQRLKNREVVNSIADETAKRKTLEFILNK